MSKDYYIKLDALEGSDDKYNGYAVGSVSPVTSQPTETNDVDYGEAVAAMTMPYKVGIWSAVKADQALRAFSQGDNGRNKDPSFDPYKVWKDNSHSPDDINTIMGMDNWEQYYLYRETKDYQNNVGKTISASGPIGVGAAVLSSIVTDPTTYMGFGVASMLGKGMKAKAAYAVGAGAAVATSEGVSQITDEYDEKPFSESLFNVAAGAVVGGALGTAVDAWKARSVLAAQGNDFNQASVNYIQDAYSVEDRFAKSVGAMAAETKKLDPENTQVLGFMARKGARGLRYLSPKLFGQSSKVPEVRELYGKVFGRNLKTVGDEAGLARQASITEEASSIENVAIGKIAQYSEDMKKIAMQGHYLDDAAEAEAILVAANGRLNLKAQPKGVSRAGYEMAKRYRDYFGGFAKKLDESGIEGYTTRNGYGAPLIFSASKVNTNIPKMVEIINEGLTKMQKGATAEVQRLQTILVQRKNSGLDFGEVETEIENLSRFARAFPEELLEDAQNAVNRFAAGQGWEAFDSAKVAKLIPKRFRPRMYEFEKVIDFVETDPNKLMGGYAREVAPFMASQKVLGDKTPYKAIDDFKVSMLEKVNKLRVEGKTKQADKLLKEITKAERSMKTGWETATGERAQKIREVMGNDVVNWLSASKSIVSITKLGNRVSASLSDINAILLHHHLKGFGGFLNTARKMAISPELRQMSKAQARIMGISMEHSKNTLLHDNIGDALHNAEIGGYGISGQVAESLRYGSAKFEKLNGGVYWDTGTRRTLMIAQQGLLKDSMQKLLKGGLHKNSATDLAFLGIDKENAGKILAQMDEFGENVDGVFFGGVEKWTDKKAADAWILALQRDGRRTSIQPGIGDTPHAFTVPGVSNLVQFKSWAVTATQVYGLSALQRADAQHMMAIGTLIGMSTAADIFDQWSRGNEINTDPDELLWAGITRSGMLGVTPELGGSWMMNKLFDIESGGSRLYDYADLSDVVGGPSLGVIKDIGGAAKPFGALLSGDEDVKFDDTWAKHFIDLLPAPFIKPVIKNAIGN